jgi:hypothetical protein
MTMIEVETLPCAGCGLTTWFSMTQVEYNAWKQGVHVQRIFPTWPPEDREMLISGTCPDCWDEMWAEDEDDWEDEDDFEMEINLLDPESGDFTYERDWYVD